MSLEVNRVETAPAPSVAVAAPSPRPSVAGMLHRSRAGWTRALQIVTGLALLRWLGAGIAGLLGYRHEVSLTLEPASLDLVGERRLLGVRLGASRRIVPLTAVRRVRLAGESAGWTLAAAAALLAVCTAAAGVLLLWGIRGRQPSWIVLALVVLGVGLALDAGAYLWVRRSARQDRATVEIVTGQDRLRVCGAPQRAASELLDRLAAREPRGQRP